VALAADERTSRLFAIAAVLAALLFGLAALLGAIGYLMSVIRSRSRSPVAP
jgi:hypothetical protein